MVQIKEKSVYGIESPLPRSFLGGNVLWYWTLILRGLKGKSHFLAFYWANCPVVQGKLYCGIGNEQLDTKCTIISKLSRAITGAKTRADTRAKTRDFRCRHSQMAARYSMYHNIENE